MPVYFIHSIPPRARGFLVWPVPPLPGRRGGTGHTMHSRARGGEGSFCGAGAAIAEQVLTLFGGRTCSALYSILIPQQLEACF